jgi:type II secretory pathway pseudopilin PulG
MNLKFFPHPKSESGAGLIEVLAAIIIIGVGIALFMKIQGRTSSDSSRNSKMLVAGKMVEKVLEDTRISIFSDTTKNWPPKDSTIPPTAPHHITVKRTVSTAYSPIDNAVVNNVKKLVLKATWTHPLKDSLSITTYVSKRF